MLGKGKLLFVAVGIMTLVLGFPSWQWIRWRMHFHFGVSELSELLNLRITTEPQGKDVVIQGDGVRLRGTLYIQTDQPRPGIVFLHGSNPKGRRTAFSRLLCEGLSQWEFHVLSLDSRGFGESEDPAPIDSLESWDQRGDVSNAIDVLIAKANVKSKPIFLVGHSQGAAEAIRSGIEEPRIEKIVAIGPPRRVRERILSEDAKEKKAFHRRFSRDRELPELLSWDTYRQVVEALLIDDQLPYFQSEHHKPILLMDGGREQEKDLVFLENLYGQMVPPKGYVTVAESDHYTNTVGLGPVILFDRIVMEKTVELIAQWLNESGTFDLLSQLRRVVKVKAETASGAGD